MGNEIDKPYKSNAVFDMKLPSDKLSDLKLEVSSSMLNSDESNLLECTDNLKLTYNKDKTIAGESYLKLNGMNRDLDGPSEGTGKLTLNILELAPVKLSGKYKYNPTAEKKLAMLNLKANYGEKDISLQTDNEYHPDVAIVNLKASSNLLHEKLRKVDLQLLYKVR